MIRSGARWVALPPALRAVARHPGRSTPRPRRAPGRISGALTCVRVAAALLVWSAIDRLRGTGAEHSPRARRLATR